MLGNGCNKFGGALIKSSKKGIREIRDYKYELGGNGVVYDNMISKIKIKIIFSRF